MEIEVEDIEIELCSYVMETYLILFLFYFFHVLLLLLTDRVGSQQSFLEIIMWASHGYN